MQHEIFEKLDAKVIGKRRGFLWEQTDLPQYLKKQGSPLLINLCNTAPLLYKNQLVTIHDMSFKVYPKAYSKSFVYLHNFVVPTIIKTSKHVVTVSMFSKDEIIRYYKTDKNMISVIYNATDESFRPVYDSDLQKENYFLAVSSLNYRKNFMALFQAFDFVATKNKDIKLYLVGDLGTNFFAKIDIASYLHNPRIKILGRVSDNELIKYYSNAQGFLYPSLYEGFGIPPLEAQSCGCPILVSNASCLPEIFEDSALYCDPFSIDSIASNMVKLFDENIRESLKAKNKQNVRRFSWNQSAISLYNLIKKYQ
jgi:glycosyltransferase involved in cell wall biosynthesis